MSFLDFDLGKGKRKRPRATRKPGISAKLPQTLLDKEESVDKAAKRLFELAENKRLHKEAERLKRIREHNISAVKLVRESHGVDVKMKLKPFPLVQGNTNKITLPPSFLEKLMQQSSIEEITPICVELALTNVDNISNSTYAGIAEFSAPEGSVGLPMKTALSLAKSSGLTLLQGNLIIVRYVKLPNYGALTVKVRPKGRGFFTENEEVVGIDIKTVLEKTLNMHTAIKLNDWIPIFSDGQYFILTIEAIRPTDPSIELKEVIEFEDLSHSVDIDEIDKEDILYEFTQTGFVILNNDVQVDILPSETDQKHLDEKKTFEELVAKVKYRLSSIASQPIEIKTVSTDTMDFKFNFPNGKKLVLKIDRSEKVSVVFEWIFFNLAQMEINYEKVDLAKMLLDKFPFKLEFPKGVKGDILLDESLDFTKSLAELGFSKRTLLFVSVPVRQVKGKETGVKSSYELIFGTGDKASVWHTAFLSLDSSLVGEGEDILEQPELLKEAGDAIIQEIYDELCNVFGVSEETARNVSSNYADSIVQLKEMGFGSRLGEAVPLLIKYRGRVVRVSNALVENS